MASPARIASETPRTDDRIAADGSDSRDKTIGMRVAHARVCLALSACDCDGFVGLRRVSAKQPSTQLALQRTPVSFVKSFNLAMHCIKCFLRYIVCLCCFVAVGPALHPGKSAPYASLEEYRAPGRSDGPMKCTWFPGTTEKSPHEHYRRYWPRTPCTSTFVIESVRSHHACHCTAGRVGRS